MSNPAHYPEFAVCGAMPEIIEGITNIEIVDWDANNLFFDVPTTFITRIGMPRLRPEFRSNPDTIFEKSIGLGLVACRILDFFDDSYNIEIPTVADPAILLIPFTGIARPRQRRT